MGLILLPLKSMAKLPLSPVGAGPKLMGQIHTPTPKITANFSGVTPGIKFARYFVGLDLQLAKETHQLVYQILSDCCEAL